MDSKQSPCAGSLDAAPSIDPWKLTANRVHEKGMAMTFGCNDIWRTDANLSAMTLTRGRGIASWPQAPTHPDASMIQFEWNANDGADEQVEFFEDLSAELAEVVYQLALGQGLGDRWLALRLALWETLTKSIVTSDC